MSEHHGEELTPVEADLHTELLHAVLRHLGKDDATDPAVGGRFMLLAFRGFSVREHFDAHHPDQIERGVEMAPPAEADREAWLFGYRFVDAKEVAP